MSFLLSRIPLQLIISWLVKALCSVTTEQWQHALELVAQAAIDLHTKEERELWVEKILKAAWPALSASTIALLRNLAVKYLQKKGLIP